MPPPGGIWHRRLVLGNISDNSSVVSIIDAMEAAFCKADLVTFTGSTIPILTRSQYSPVRAFKPNPGLFSVFTLSTTTEPSRPALLAIVRRWFFKGAFDDVDAGLLIALGLYLAELGDHA